MQDALDATWPAARVWHVGPFRLRDGQGGGRRVSAATATSAAILPTDIAAAVDRMRAIGQTPLFRLTPQDAALDADLAALGFRQVDPTLIYAAPVTAFGAPPPAMAAFPHWPPLGIAAALWQAAGITAPRQAVMARVAGAKTAILARMQDRAAGIAFVAVHGATAMLHALEVPEALRRKGAARAIMGRAACWAGEQDASELALAVTAANAPARALYESLGMQVAGRYHYRELAGQ